METTGRMCSGTHSSLGVPPDRRDPKGPVMSQRHHQQRELGEAGPGPSGDPPKIPHEPRPHPQVPRTFLPADTPAVVKSNPGGSSEGISHEVLHSHVCGIRARQPLSTAAGPEDRREPGRATLGAAITSVSRAERAGAPDEGRTTPTATCATCPSALRACTVPTGTTTEAVQGTWWRFGLR